jgi:hypothetical protein
VKFDDDLPHVPLCKWKKEEMKAALPVLAQHLPAGTLMCKKCARIADREEWLCKPVKLRKLLKND